jgi:hypothetical protein
VVLVILASVARAGRERVTEGKMRNLKSPVPEGGSSLSFRLKKSIIKRPLKKTGILNPVTDNEDIIRSVKVPLL